jgi:DNA-binding NarL/FixJ family response regulator
MNPAVVLLIDDHALFRAGLRMMLESGLSEIRMLESESLEQALRMEAPAQINLVLLDIHLQGLNGIEGIALVKRRWADVPVAMLSSQFDAQTRQSALDRGAVAMLSKAQPPEDFLGTVRQLLEGVQALAPASRADGSAPRLTPRQAEVLDLLCQGLSNKAIGRRLDLSEHTVRGHVQATLAALGASSRTEAVYAARRAGLLA